MKIVLNLLRKIFTSLVIILGTILTFSCTPLEPRYEKLLGTICFVNLYESGSKECYDEIFNRLYQIDSEFSIGYPTSDICRINNLAYEKPITVCDDVFSVIQMAQRISSLTDGAFDISIEPLVRLWNVNSDKPHIASQREIEERLPLINYQNIILDEEKKSIQFKEKNMKIDLGGIAKGFAADEVVKICKRYKIKRAVIDLGGNIYVYGKKNDKSLWNVGVKNPEYPDAAPVLKIKVPQISAVTSGKYERFFEADKKRYHHILSPKNGYPIENDLSSVTILSTNSMLADALTTAFFVLGRKQSTLIIPTIKEVFNEDFEAIFIDTNHNIYFSEKFPFEYTVLYQGWYVK